MDDIEGLRRATLQAIQNRLSATGRQMVCELCSATSWSIGDFIRLSTQDPRKGGMIIGGPSLPLVAITCAICGNTKFINLIRLGILSNEMQHTETPADVAKRLISEEMPKGQ